MLFAQSVGLSLPSSSVIVLINLVDREISRVDVGRQPRLERSANLAKMVPNDTFEKGMSLDFCASHLTGLASKAIVGVTKKANCK